MHDLIDIYTRTLAAAVRHYRDVYGIEVQARYS